MSEHTPGPWKVGHRAMDVVAPRASPKGEMKVCDIRGWGYLTGKGHGALGLPDSEAIAIQEANARLIAVAPDMLVALKRLIDNMPRPDGHGCLAALVFAERIVAKADGRSPEGIARLPA